MKKYLTILTFLFSFNAIYSHCQVPCGIYDDAMRIVILQEDFKTIKKAMKEIDSLSKMKDGQSLNQLNRWITTKDQHSTNIQRVVSDYFMTQRVKDKNSHYTDQLKYLHQILVYAMKSKQSVDEKNVNNGLKYIEDFSEVYFDEHGLEHLRKMSE